MDNEILNEDLFIFKSTISKIFEIFENIDKHHHNKKFEHIVLTLNKKFINSYLLSKAVHSDKISHKIDTSVEMEILYNMTDNVSIDLTNLARIRKIYSKNNIENAAQIKIINDFLNALRKTMIENYMHIFKQVDNENRDVNEFSNMLWESFQANMRSYKNIIFEVNDIYDETPMLAEEAGVTKVIETTLFDIQQNLNVVIKYNEIMLTNHAEKQKTKIEKQIEEIKKKYPQKVTDEHTEH